MGTGTINLILSSLGVMEKDFDEWNTLKKRLHKDDVTVYANAREIWFCSIGVKIKGQLPFLCAAGFGTIYKNETPLRGNLGGRSQSCIFNIPRLFLFSSWREDTQEWEGVII